VFGNLIHNARKFTANGARIDVAVAREGAEAVIRVRDEGVGIPLDKLGAVFEMFTQIGSPGGPSSGLGIGLALARRIVELHGGTIEARSGRRVAAAASSSFDCRSRTPRKAKTRLRARSMKLGSRSPHDVRRAGCWSSRTTSTARARSPSSCNCAAPRR
jgi:K+-sensing histidine kinase KdpD